MSRNKQKSMGSKRGKPQQPRITVKLEGEALKRDIMRRYRISSKQYDRVIQQGQKRNANSL